MLLSFLQRHANLIAAIATVACCNISIGLTFQLNPLLLEAAGWSKRDIGLVVAMGPIGILLAAPIFPKLIGTFGNKLVVGVGIAVLLASLALFNMLPYAWWFVLRFFFGIALGLVFTASETWLMAFSDERTRGRVFGIYTSVLTFTFAIGPLLIPFTGIHGWLPWFSGIAFVLLGVLVLATIRPGEIKPPQEGHGIFAVVKRKPMLFAGIAAVTFFESMYIPFFVIFGTDHGRTLDMASFILGFGIVGCAVLYFPFGYVSDHVPRAKLVMVSAALAIVLSLLLLPAITHWSIWPLILALRLFAVGVYIVSFAMIGDTFRGESMLSAGAAVSILWGLGGLVAPPIAGMAIDQFGSNALPLLLAGVFAVFLAAFAASQRRVVK